MNYRFEKGGLSGHSFGNLLLSALEKVTGSFDEAVERAGDILRIRGRVIPATLEKVKLVAHLKNGKVIRGQYVISQSNISNLEKIVLEPNPKANPKAIEAIKEADLVVVGPGDLYTSLIPNFLISGIPQALQKSRATKLYICNLMTRLGHTEGFSVRDFNATMEHYTKTKFDYIIYNNKRPNAALLKRYAREGDALVPAVPGQAGKRFIGADLISKKSVKRKKSDPLRRNLIRHNQERLAMVIVGILTRVS